jgi:hypothetical protein
MRMMGTTSRTTVETSADRTIVTVGTTETIGVVSTGADYEHEAVYLTTGSHEVLLTVDDTDPGAAAQALYRLASRVALVAGTYSLRARLNGEVAR